MLVGKIIGTEQITQRLNNTISDNKIEQALDKGALLVEGDAKQLVRVDTGRLRASINIIKLRLERRIGSNVVYAPAQEFGRPDLTSYGYTPYLRPALRKNRNRILQETKNVIGQR
jgi:hypothetical protein